MRTGAAIAAAAILSASAGVARADGMRVGAGPAVALDPGFVAAAASIDFFPREHWGLGLSHLQTVPRAGDRSATESGYGITAALLRLRSVPQSGVTLEGLAGAAVARITYGSPGAHRETAPGLAIGASLGLAITPTVEVAAEATTFVLFGARTGTRNPGHTSEGIALLFRTSHSRR